MIHVKRIDEMANGNIVRAIVNPDDMSSSRHEYEATFQHNQFGKNTEYKFIVYANDEDLATDILFDYLKNNHEELIADVPEDFTNDYGYDDEDGGYTPYGEDSPYLFNTNCDIAVYADEFVSMDEIK